VSAARRPRASARRAADLVAAGVIAPERAAAVDAVAARYAMAVTPEMLALIDPADPADPIARQFLPDPRELKASPGESPDPIGDERHSPVKGVVHRYPDRVLLKPLHACPVYCRFCFRREMVGPQGEALSATELDAALGYVAAHGEIAEVILSGGDPLMLSARRLEALVARLEAIPHVEVLRVHSRVPVVDPTRVTPALVRALKPRRLAPWLAVHCNHPRELTEAARTALGRLADAGIALLGQTVLLKGVNDDAEVLAGLMRAMLRARIKPYYLHHADLAPGTAHFRTTLATGQRLMRRLRGRFSGLAQPSYVLDIPGGHGKAPAGPSYLRELGGTLEIEDWQGRRHRYADGKWA
jgi:lysine 2,3-aminomutase